MDLTSRRHCTALYQLLIDASLIFVFYPAALPAKIAETAQLPYISYLWIAQIVCKTGRTKPRSGPNIPAAAIKGVIYQDLDN